MIFPPDLSPEDIERALETERFGRSLDVRMATGSTNDEARVAAQQGEPDGHVIVADRQTHGRGTRGRDWSSPAGLDLYFSILLTRGLTAESLALLTLATGLGVAKASQALTERPVGIKWPNDLWIEDRKAGGILVESKSTGGDLDCVVIGVGVNVNRQTFDGELSTLATSLRGESADPLNRAHVLAALLSGIEAEVCRVEAGAGAKVVDEVKAYLVGLGERGCCDGHTGELRGLDAQGSLLLWDGERELPIRNGTLSFPDGRPHARSHADD